MVRSEYKNTTSFMRVDKTKNYSVINNDFLRRTDLSWKAKGILAYVLSLPDDWNIVIDDLIKRSTDGKASFRSGWKELEEQGYIKRYPVREGQRITHWETVIYEKSQLTDNQEVEKKPDVKGNAQLSSFQEVENQEVGFQEVENQPLLSTKDTKYLNKLSTKNTKSDKSDNIPYKEIVDYLNETADKRFRHTTGKTKTLIKARFNEGFTVDDFKKVIDVKTAEWKKDSNMNKYLRPETLFGTKFESYLNQPMNNNWKGGNDQHDQYRDLYKS